MRKIDVNVKYLHEVWSENDLAYATDYSQIGPQGLYQC